MQEASGEDQFPLRGAQESINSGECRVVLLIAPSEATPV
jgi:hypothetical protein